MEQFLSALKVKIDNTILFMNLKHYIGQLENCLMNISQEPMTQKIIIDYINVYNFLFDWQRNRCCFISISQAIILLDNFLLNFLPLLEAIVVWRKN